ncbi:carbonic anhydrase [Bifidobacterium sp. UBA744]|uniref:carbonic anhydrase n=1 Tax=Bifidobacterium sp. UBA744 TaxID=1946112 RepID=UPI0025C0F8F5|nr:carbonic anhydrase [Bifidobacterium sp. UBA744]
MTDDFDAPLEQESTANATWSRMLQGNRRFAEGKAEHPWQDGETRESLIDQQNPDAAVLACADSRVPPEIIFDQGLGDLFDVRTAGQMIDDAVVTSLEYAVNKLKVSLIVVLGHEHCGAIEQAIRELDKLGDLKDEELETRISEADSRILRAVGISVHMAREAELDSEEDFERVHIAHTIEDLVERSGVIQEALADERLMIVGARYSLTTGKVEVLSF